MAKKLTNDEVIKRITLILGPDIDFSRMEYKGRQTKITLGCKKCGNWFEKTPDALFSNSKSAGCPNCTNGIIFKLNTTEVKKRITKILGPDIDFSRMNFKTTLDKIELGCPKCGKWFFKKPNDIFIQKQGCTHCAKNSKLDSLTIKNRIIEILGENIKFDKFVYVAVRKKVILNCAKHGYFKIAPSQIFNQRQGCPECSKELHRSKGEERILRYIEENNLKYKTEYKFSKSTIQTYRFDFYLPKENTLIEYDGKQHFEAVEYFGGERTFLETQRRDKIKTDFAKTENIKLIRIPYTDFNKIEEILNKELICKK